MSEWRLFEEGTVPEYATPEWYAGREVAPHLEQEGHRDRLELAAAMVQDAVARGLSLGRAVKTVVDLGAGDGGLLSLLGPFVERWGYDLQPSNAEGAAQRGERVEVLDVVANWPHNGEEADIVVATEMLEHLLDPHEFVRRIANTKANYFVASSPYTETDNDHYEYHLWAWDITGYREMLENNGWRVIRQERAWICQVLLAEKL